MKHSLSRPQRAAFKRSTLAVALGICLGSMSMGIHAQSANGSIFGDAKSGSTITIENVGTGSKREITVGSDGRYSLPQLPTGDYRVSAEGESHNVHVTVGTGSHVDFAGTNASTLATIQVQGNAINPIDVSSVESTTVFSKEQLANLPVARNTTAVALLAPGTVKADSAFGTPSFGGASAAENAYYINGFDVTNIRNFLSYASLPFNAVAEEQVKTGGYGAEYGRSLGGVISLVTERGTNQWHYGTMVMWTPDFSREQAPNALDRRYPGDYYKFDQANMEKELQANIYVSGPLVKDKLFVFAMLQGEAHSWSNYGKETSSYNWNNSPSGILKLDWNITDKHILEFTGIDNRNTDHHQNYSNDDAQGNIVHPYATSFNTPTTESRNTYGGHVEILKYTGYLADNFTLSAQYGDLKNADGTRDPRNYRSGNCPWALDGRNYPGHPGDNGASIPLTNLGCFDPNALTSYDTKPADETDHRKAGRLDLEWKLGDHDLRFGYDGEKFTSTHIGTTITGGAYYRYYSYVSGKKVNGVTPPAGTTEYVRVRHDNTPSGSFEVDNTAAYLEDNWKLNDKWLLYVGLRDETFNNKNGEGKSFAKKDNLIAPRLGLSWDITGDSTNKLSATLGRYYIPIASNTNIRASAAELFTHDYYTFSGVDPVTGAPITLGQKLGNTQVLENGVTPNPGSVVATSLKPMSQDELIVGFEHKFNQEWSGGVRGVLRKVNNGMDDTCWHGAFDNWAADKGYTNFDSGQLANCVLVNPGKSNSFNLDLQGDGKLSNVSIPAKYFNLPDYKRKYTALEFFFERAWDDKWFLQGSYTWAHSYGTSEGYVESNLQQSDAGISQSFDFPTLEHGDNGNLPNDRRHAFKLFGAYQVAPTWRLSANLLVQSGRPQSCFGIAPQESPDYGDPSNGSGGAGGYNASSFYCNVGGTHPVVINGTTYDAPNQVLRPRGTAGTTPWLYQVDVGVQWMPKIPEGKLSFRADIFNVFNRHTPVRTNPFHEYRNADVPGGITIDPNYGQVDDYQQPRVLQLTARYDY